MAQQVSALAYLQHAPPALPLDAPNAPSGNTTNKNYSSEDIHAITHWQGFDLAVILQQYGHLLQNTLMDDEQMPASPPVAISSESSLRYRINEYLQVRVRRALRSVFATHGDGPLQGYTAVSFYDGDTAAIIRNYKPDLAYLDLGAAKPRANRAPGDVKPSWKWHSSWGQSQNVYKVDQYKQALAQVNFYMKLHNSRYGCILTDEELVAIRGLDDNGNLELATPTPWHVNGTQTNPRLTVLLGLWYLGMLAAQNTGPNRWNM